MEKARYGVIIGLDEAKKYFLSEPVTSSFWEVFDDATSRYMPRKAVYHYDKYGSVVKKGWFVFGKIKSDPVVEATLVKTIRDCYTGFPSPMTTYLGLGLKKGGKNINFKPHSSNSLQDQLHRLYKKLRHQLDFSIGYGFGATIRANGSLDRPEIIMEIKDKKLNYIVNEIKTNIQSKNKQ